ncbi:MAG: hypothetical protein K2N30_00620, partial [Clostridia bacterium]|nr:hypothetical protein [Clostridia bacterium]
MKSWLKFFGLSFFSDKIAKEARIRGILNCVLGFVLALVFIFCGVLAANTVPFYTHYDNASRFKQFVYSAMEKADLSVKEGKVSCGEIINTHLNGADAEKYSQEGYNLVIDTRPSTALDDFEAYCVAKDGTEISYEDYLALSEEDKGGYDFKIRYTANELILTDELTAGHEKYLGESANEEIKKQYDELVQKKADMTAEEYKSAVYALYIKAYYPNITAYERAGEVPLLRSFYYRNYLYSSKTEKSLFIFEDVLFGYFATDAGIAVNFYGYYGNAEEGAITATGADGFIKSAFASSVSV